MNRFDWSDDTLLREAVMQALGAASVCWQPPPRGVFQDHDVIDIGDELIAWIEATE